PSSPQLGSNRGGGLFPGRQGIAAFGRCSRYNFLHIYRGKGAWQYFYTGCPLGICCGRGPQGEEILMRLHKTRDQSDDSQQTTMEMPKTEQPHIPQFIEALDSFWLLGATIPLIAWGCFLAIRSMGYFTSRMHIQLFIITPMLIGSASMFIYIVIRVLLINTKKTDTRNTDIKEKYLLYKKSQDKTEKALLFLLLATEPLARLAIGFTYFGFFVNLITSGRGRA
ncbi:MAG: hypothetical protein KGZ62_01320, partial [Sulfurimonas sp.]|nr:hypothetical protein [Sulfurimonas sp.]